jgi:hypothetical protein
VEVENWDDKVIKFLSLFLKFKQSLTQLQHLIDVSIKKTKTRDVFYNVLLKFDETLTNLIELLTEYYSFIEPNFKNKPLRERLNYFKEELLGYNEIFDFYPLLKKATKKMKEGEAEIINEFKRKIGIKFKDKQGNEEKEITIDILQLRELERKLLELMEITERLVKEVKSGKIERSYKV